MRLGGDSATTRGRAAGAVRSGTGVLHKIQAAMAKYWPEAVIL
jgi:hypothetical protein